MLSNWAGGSGINAVGQLAPAAWYRYGIGLTDAGAGACSAWADQSGNGKNLTASGAARPTIQSDNSILFSANFMQVTISISQPFTVYLLGRQVTWTAGNRIFDSLTAVNTVAQNGTTPELRFNAGASLAGNTNLPINTYGIISVVGNGATSILQINNTPPLAGDAGTNAIGTNFVLGAAGDGLSAWSNIQVKELILFSAAHDATTRSLVIRYLARVGGISV